jgi:type VI secretion system protein ImpF
MSKVRADQPLMPSLLDRLIDLEPENSKEAAPSRNQVLRELKHSVRRDLENLLNSRRCCVSPDAGLKELKQSLLNYGLPDFMGMNMGAVKDREEFCRQLQAVIKQYEPRFKTVKVQLLTNAEPLDRTLRFRIDALMYADPAPEAVIFDSSLEPSTGIVQVKGASG